MAKLLGGVAVILMLVACSPAADNQTTQNDIIAVEQAFMAAFSHGDATGISKLYSTEAKLLPSNRDFVSGRDDIRHFWQGLMNLGIEQVKLETLEVEHCQDQAYEMGRYTIHTAEDEMIDYGKYLVTWKQVEGTWYLHRHMWTTSMIKAHESRI